LDGKVLKILTKEKYRRLQNIHNDRLNERGVGRYSNQKNATKSIRV